jgi:hypothetical protein
MSFENYYKQVCLRYELERLLQDLAEFKGLPLSEKETLYLCAALMGKELQEVADYLHIAIQSAQVFVSDTIKKYIKDLSENQPIKLVSSRLPWHRLPHICQALGYERSGIEPPSRFSDHPLRQVSVTASQFDIPQLICEMAIKRDRILFQGEQPIVAASLATITNDQINQILAPVLDLDEIPGARRDAYLEVIKLRWGLVLQDPVSYLEQAVKIVQDLNMIKCYVDSVPLALELIPQVQTPQLKGQLQECIGRAVAAIAKSSWEDWRRQEAIFCYQSAVNRGTHNNCAPLFNIFKLNFEFAQQFPHSPKHQADARQALRHFVNVANQPDYNFAIYRSAIQQEVQSIVPQTQDPVLLSDFAQVLAWP